MGEKQAEDLRPRCKKIVADFYERAIGEELQKAANADSKERSKSRSRSPRRDGSKSSSPQRQKAHPFRLIVSPMRRATETGLLAFDLMTMPSEAVRNCRKKTTPVTKSGFWTGFKLAGNAKPPAAENNWVQVHALENVHETAARHTCDKRLSLAELKRQFQVDEDAAARAAELEYEELELHNKKVDLEEDKKRREMEQSIRDSIDNESNKLPAGTKLEKTSSQRLCFLIPATHGINGSVGCDECVVEHGGGRRWWWRRWRRSRWRTPSPT